MYGGRQDRLNNLMSVIPKYEEHDFDCLIFVFDGYNASLESFLKPCHILQQKGYASTLAKNIRPEYISRSHYEHVIFHAEDISVRADYNPHHLTSFIRQFGLDVATPIISGSIWPVMNAPVWNGSTPSPVGRMSTFIEFQLTAFTALAWTCMWDMIDESVNPIGWGYDQCLFQICDSRIGILDTVVVYHGLPNGGDVHASNNWPLAGPMLTAFLASRNESRAFRAACLNAHEVGKTPNITLLY